MFMLTRSHSYVYVGRLASLAPSRVLKYIHVEKAHGDKEWKGWGDLPMHMISAYG